MVKLIAKKAEKRNLTYMIEPHISLSRSFCKSDIIVIKDLVAYVIDFSICDPTNCANAYNLKKEKYGNLETVSRTKLFLQFLGHPVEKITQFPLICTYRGISHSKSTQHLLHFNFSKLDVSDVCLATLNGSIKSYDCYMRGTQTFR